MTDLHKESNSSPTCDKCGAVCTTGMMAAFCSRGRECEFWPHSNGEVALAGGELLMYRFWMDNTLEQIGLQIEDRERLERELSEARLAISDCSSKWRPMSEAPTKSGYYLVWIGPLQSKVGELRGHLQMERYTANDNVPEEYFGAVGWKTFERELAVQTHWMPLPEAPK